MKAVVNKHKVVSEAEWLKARGKLLLKEKEFTRLQEELNLERRSLPWVKVTKANRRSPTYLKDAVNSLSITSCSGRTTRQDAHTAR